MVLAGDGQAVTAGEAVGLAPSPPTIDGVEGDNWKYDAFISYNHEADAGLAGKLRRRLERIATPFYRRAESRVFLDNSSMTASPDLWGTVAEAIDTSRYFVLLASPQAAESPWVNRELRRFLRRPNGADRILVILTSGDLVWDTSAKSFDPERSTSLPSALDRVFTHEPLYVDLRWLHSSADRSNRRDRLRNDLATVAAPIRGVEKEEIISEDIRQLRLYLYLVSGLAAGLLAAAVVAALYQRQAEHRADQALSEAVGALALAEAPNRLDRALLLAASAPEIADTDGARRAQFSVLAAAGSVELFLHDHPAPIRTIAASQDGEVIVTADVDGHVIVRDAELVPVHPAIPVQGGAVREAVLSTDRRYLFVASGQSTVSLIDLESATVVESADIGTGEVELQQLWALALTPDERLVYVGRWDGSIVVLDAADLSVRGETQTDLTRIRSLVFDDSGLLAIAGRSQSAAGGRVLIVDTDGWATVADTNDFPDWVSDLRTVPSLIFDPHQEGRVVFGSFNGSIYRWPFAEDRQPDLLGRHEQQVARLRLSSDEEWMVSTSFDHSILLWDTKTWQPVGAPRIHHGGQVWDAAIVEDGSVISGSEDGTLARFRIGPASPLGRVVRAERSDRMVLAEVDGIEVLAIGTGAEIELLSTSTLESVEVLTPGPAADQSPPSPVTAVGYDRGESLLIAGHEDRTVIVWDLETKRPLVTLNSNLRPTAVAKHPTEPVVVVGGYRGSDVEAGEVEVVSIETGVPEGPSMVGLDGLTLLDIEFNVDGSRLFIAGQPTDRSLFSWSTRSPSPALSGLSDETAAVGGEFSPSGVLAIGTDRQRIELIDPSGRINSPLAGHGDVVFSTAFSPDGALLASGGGDGTVVLWELGERQAALGPPLLGHTGSVRRVVYSGDGTRLFSGGLGELIVWNLDGDDWQDMACEIANRTMTESEWRAAVGEHPLPEVCTEG